MSSFIPFSCFYCYYSYLLLIDKETFLPPKGRKNIFLGEISGWLQYFFKYRFPSSHPNPNQNLQQNNWMALSLLCKTDGFMLTCFFFGTRLYSSVITRWLLYLILFIFRLPFPNSQPTNDLSESSNIKLETLLCRHAVTVTFLPTGQLSRDAHSQSCMIHIQSIHFLFFLR